MHSSDVLLDHAWLRRVSDVLFAVLAVTGIFLSTPFVMSSHLAWFITESVHSIHPAYIPGLLVVPVGAYHFPSEKALFFLMLFKLSCLSSRLSSGIKRDVCPQGLLIPSSGNHFLSDCEPWSRGVYLLSLICGTSSLLMPLQADLCSHIASLVHCPST